MKYLIKLLMVLGALILASNNVNAASVIVNGQTAGATPFIRNLQLTASPANSVSSITFQITPKPGSVTRPLRAKYSANYLIQHGNYSTANGSIFLPVFGLYANYSNSVTLTFQFTDNSSQQTSVAMPTAAFTNDPCNYQNPTVIQPRTNSTSLSYDYIFVRNACGSSPIVLDTDGQPRWVGTRGFADVPATFFQNSVFQGHGTNFYRTDLDGTSEIVRDLSSAGVVNIHHNIDNGKTGLVLDVDTSAQVESINMEVDADGNILKTWNLADIISAAMTAGGDTASQFVQPSPNDWFHNNSTTYRKADDTLLVSSRENFVIALDYASGAIKWILGDTTKHWGQFPSLTHFALNLGPNTLPPIGQHALSITKDGSFLLFDNGRNSANHTPPGVNRTYSAPRKYAIDTQSKVATELWNYPNNQSIFSEFCSSIAEDRPQNYLIDYAYITNLAPPALFAEILGLDEAENKIFDYRYPTQNCSTAYNSIPVHWEQLVLSSVVAPTVVSRQTHGLAGALDIPLPLIGPPGVECRSATSFQIVATFAGPVTLSSATVTPAPGATAVVDGAPIINGNTVTVNLANVSDEQVLAVNLIGVSDGTNVENFSVPMAVLVGDTTANYVVNSSDLSAVKTQSGKTVTLLNFRADLSVNGLINSGDVSLAKSQSGSGIPLAGRAGSLTRINLH